MQPIATFLDSLKLGRLQAHHNMALFPLLAQDAGPPGYLTLDEAISNGAVRVTEVDEAGSVPELKVVNLSSEKILVVDGEELVGAKQNRVVNATFLIPPKGQVVIPVSCVEQGRWEWRSRTLFPGKVVMPMFLRKAHVKKVSESISRGEGFRSDQHMIWDELDGLARRVNATAPSRAMSDVYEETSSCLEGYLRAFRLVDCQVGALFALNGKVVGLEAFYHQSTFSSFFPKVIRSYAMDAMISNGPSRRPSRRQVLSFLQGIRGVRMQPVPSLGLGENLRLDGGSIVGAGLVVEGRPLHLVAFRAAPEERGGGGSPMERFSSRSRRFVE